MAARQFGSFRAARAEVGMGDMAGGVASVFKAYRGLGLTMSALERVSNSRVRR
jgi:hypothetical protein